MDIQTVPLTLDRKSPPQMIEAASAFADTMARRRTVRDFSPEPIPMEVVTAAVRAAATAPSGANLQPWRFVVMTDPDRKRRLREAAEAEEREFYDRRASEEWLEALAALGTDWRKPFLEIAPVVIVVFEVHQGPDTPRPYYVKESVASRSGCCWPPCTRPGWPR